MKSVLISIQPQWCELIASSEKTLEVRKTRPKLETPFKVYIYCTLSGCNEFFRDILGGDIARWNREKWADKKGMVIGEFVCDKIFEVEVDYTIHDELPGRPMETWLTWENAHDGYETPEDIENASCLTLEKIDRYIGTADRCYCWHISDLVIYDKPKELSDFTPHCRFMMDDMLQCDYRKVACNCQAFDHNPWPDYSVNAVTCKRRMQRPPQSWCYVEEVPDNGK